VSKVLVAKRGESEGNIGSEEGKRLRVNRFIQVGSWCFFRHRNGEAVEKFDLTAGIDRGRRDRICPCL